jgi:hypothetical protein
MCSYEHIVFLFADIQRDRRRAQTLQLKTAKNIMRIIIRTLREHKGDDNEVLVFLCLRERLFKRPIKLLKPREADYMKRLTLEEYNKSVLKQLQSPLKKLSGGRQFRQKRAFTVPREQQLTKAHTVCAITKQWAVKDAENRVNKENGEKWVIV